jgi:hypothetical protein
LKTVFDQISLEQYHVLLATESKLGSSLEGNKPRSMLALLVAGAEGNYRSTHQSEIMELNKKNCNLLIYIEKKEEKLLKKDLTPTAQTRLIGTAYARLDVASS